MEKYKLMLVGFSVVNPEANLSQKKYSYFSTNEDFCFFIYKATKKFQPEVARLVLGHGVTRFPRRHKLWYWLGNVNKRLGLYNDARFCYEKSYSINRWSPQLAYVLSGLVDFKKTDVHPVEENLERLLSKGVLDGKNKALAQFSLGKIFLDKKRYEEAFSWYQKGNLTVSKKLKPKLNISKSDLENIRTLFDSGYFHPAFSGPVQARGPEVFISGMSRSGKTLLENILSSSGFFIKGGESQHLANVCKSFIPGNKFSNVAQFIEALKNTTLASMRKKYASGFSEKEIVYNTLPWSIRYFGMLGRLYPASPIIFITRNFMDLGVSTYFKIYRNRYAFSYDLYELGKQIRIYEELQKYWASVLPNPVFFVSYENLVNDTEVELKRVINFLEPATLFDTSNMMNKLKESGEAPVSPGQSVDGSVKLRKDFVGFSVNFADKLIPLIRGYNEVLD